jgi:hypothetical protein
MLAPCSHSLAKPKFINHGSLLDQTNPALAIRTFQRLNFVTLCRRLNAENHRFKEYQRRCRLQENRRPIIMQDCVISGSRTKTRSTAKVVRPDVIG